MKNILEKIINDKKQSLELIKKDAVLSKYLKDKLIKRKIYIKNRLINIIV